MDKYQIELNKLIKKQERRIKKIYAMLANEAAISIKEHKMKSATSVWFRNRRIERLLDQAFAKFRKELKDLVLFQVQTGWDLANEKNNVLVNTFLKNQEELLPEGMEEAMRDINEPALRAFNLRRKAGLTLSNRVWDLTSAMKEQMEGYLAEGIHRGTPAAQLATQIKQYLLYPDKVFRRVRDPKTGKLKLSKPAKAFKPGRGVYRSSFKNAMRIARTETNMSYNYADYLRRRNLFFVIGFEVRLAHNHPKFDICDHLKGKYPKEFLFTGWHPQCLCYTTSVQMDKKEWRKYLRGEKYKIEPIKGIPYNARRYINNNQERFLRMKNKPYWLEDNFKISNLSKFDPDLVNFALQERIGKTNIEDISTDFRSVKAVDENILYGKAHLLDTMGMYRDSDGRWLPEREALHKKILDELMAKKSTKGGVNIWQDEEFKEWFGESWVTDKKGDPLLVYHGAEDPFHFKSAEKALEGKIIYVFRGEGNRWHERPENIDETVPKFMQGNQGFFWTTTSYEEAKKYAEMQTYQDGGKSWNIEQYEILAPKNPFNKITDPEFRISKRELIEILEDESSKFRGPKASRAEKDKWWDIKWTLEDLNYGDMDKKLRFTDIINKQEDSGIWGSALDLLGYDAIEMEEGGATSYGILRDSFKNVMARQPQGWTFFSEDINTALTYGAELKKAYLKLENPLVVEGHRNTWDTIPFMGGFVGTDTITEWAKKNGYDGVIFRNVIDYGSMPRTGNHVPTTQYVVFNPADQIWEADRRVYMMGGAPANGKSTVLESEHFKNIGIGDRVGDLAVVNSDDIKDQLPEYVQMQNRKDNYAAAMVHEESSYLAKQYIQRLLEEDYDFMLDGVNDGSLEKIMKKVGKYQYDGARVIANYVTLDPDLSIKLAKVRSQKVDKKTGEFLGRYVPLNFVAAMNQEMPKIIRNLQEQGGFDEFFLWDTNTIGRPVLIASMKGRNARNFKIHDQQLWEEFLWKENWKYE